MDKRWTYHIHMYVYAVQISTEATHHHQMHSYFEFDAALGGDWAEREKVDFFSPLFCNVNLIGVNLKLLRAIVRGLHPVSVLFD